MKATHYVVGHRLFTATEEGKAKDCSDETGERLIALTPVVGYDVDGGFEGEPIQIASKSAVGDLMGFLLEEFKAAPAAWHNLSEAQQKAVAERAERRCAEAVRQTAEHIAKAAATGLIDLTKFDDGSRPSLEAPPVEEIDDEDNPEGPRRGRGAET